MKRAILWLKRLWYAAQAGLVVCVAGYLVFFYLAVWRVSERRVVYLQRLAALVGRELAAAEDEVAARIRARLRAQAAAGEAGEAAAPSEAAVGGSFFFVAAEPDEWAQGFRVIVRFAPKAGFEPLPEASAFEITPEVAGLQVERTWDDQLRLAGDWQPGTNYRIALKPGLTDAKGRVLGADRVRQVRIPDRTPNFRFLTPGLYLPLKRMVLPYSAVNLPEEAAMRVARAYENNLMPLGYEAWWARVRMQPLGEVPLKPEAAPRNLTVNQLFDLGEAVGHKPGVYALSSTGISPAGDGEARTVIATDIGVAWVADGQTGFGVSLRRLSDNAPIAGATIEVAGEKNQPLLRGTSDVQGLALLAPVPGAEARGDFPASKMVVRTREGDFVYLSLRETGHAGGAPDNGHAPLPAAALWFDRGAVRPGESIRVWALVHQAQQRAPLAQCPLTLQLLDARWQCVERVQLESDALGMLAHDFTLSASAIDGLYTVELSLGQEVLSRGWYQVVDFVPERVRLGLELTRDRVEVAAKTYFGACVAGASTEVTVRACEALPSDYPQAWEAWTVGRSEGACPERTAYLTTRADGTCALDFDLLSGRTFNAPICVEAEVSLTEPGGRTVSGSACTELCYTERAYVGLQQTGEALPQATLLVPEGSDCTQAEAELALTRITSRYLGYIDDEGTYRREWVETKTPVALANSRLTLRQGEAITLPLSALEPGQYTACVRLCGEGEQPSSELTFWYGECLAEFDARRHLTDLPIELPLRPCTRGSRTELACELPCAGTLLVAAGAERLRTFQSFEVAAAGRQSFPLEIPADELGACYPVFVTFTSADADIDTRLFGRADLPLDQTDAQLSPTLSAPEVVRPGSTACVRFTLPPAADSVPRQVVLWAIDSGVLAVSGMGYPTPLSDLTAPRSWLVCGDLYGKLYPRLKIDAPGQIGGDTWGLAEKLSEQPLARVLFDARAIPAEGTLAFDLPVPEGFQGELTLLAVAADGAGRVGTCTRTLTVRPPMTLSFTLPRALCAGDTAAVTFTVQNHDLPGDPFRLVAQGDREVASGTLAPGEQARFTLPVTFGEDCRELSATLTMGEEHLTVREAVLLREAAAQQRATVYTLLAPGAPVSEGAEVLGLEAWQDRTRAWFSAYPYDCTEQLSAKAWPTLLSAEPVDRALLAALCAQLRPRHREGRFDLWPQGGYREAASLMAAHVLLTAMRRQVAAEDRPLRSALHRELRSVAAEGKTRSARAFALWVLAHDGAFNEAEPVWAQNLLASSKDDAAALFASAALIRAGYAAAGSARFQRAYAADQAPLFADYMDEAAWHAAKVALALEGGFEVASARFAELFAARWETTQANAWGGYAFALAGARLGASARFVRQQVLRAASGEGQAIAVQRRLLNEAGEEVDTLAHGALAYVRIDFTLPCAVRDLALRDLLPGGLEYEDGALATRTSRDLPAWAKALENRFEPEASSKRAGDNRFFGSASAGKHTLIYPVRAVVRGTYRLPATCVEAMYNPELTGAAAGAGTLTID